MIASYASIFSPNSRQIVATERDIAARLYNVADGQRLWEFVILPEGSAESYTSDVTFRPDGKQIAVGAPIGPENTIRLLDPTTGKETARLTGSGWKPWDAAIHERQPDAVRFRLGRGHPSLGREDEPTASSSRWPSSFSGLCHVARRSPHRVC